MRRGMYGMAGRMPATTQKRGTVKQAAARANVGAAPTQAEFNDLLQKLRDAGILAA